MAGVGKSAKCRMVAINERGRVVGEDHPRAVLSNHDVDLVFALREEGLSLGQIARAMEVCKSTVQKILEGSRRGQIVAGYRRVPLKG